MEQPDKKNNHTSLFERIGGGEAIEDAVIIMYSKIVSDLQMNYYFRKTDMSVLVGKLSSFLSYIFGATTSYSGEDIREVHEHLRIPESDFDKLVIYLEQTLKEMGFFSDLIEEVKSEMEKRRFEVVVKTSK